MSKERMIKISGKMDLPTETPNKNGRIYSEKSIQEWVKEFRKLNEQEEPEAETQKRVNKKTPQDEDKMRDWFNDVFRGLNITPEFEELVIYDDLVFWSGWINGLIQFIFTVSENPDVNNVEINYADDLNIQNPENDKIVKKLEDFYTDFSEYWKKELFEV